MAARKTITGHRFIMKIHLHGKNSQKFPYEILGTLAISVMVEPPPPPYACPIGQGGLNVVEIAKTRIGKFPARWLFS